MDCITAIEDNAAAMDDHDLLDRATALGRPVVTADRDFLIEAERRQSQDIEFAGVIYAHPLRVSVRASIDDIDIIAKVGTPADLANRVHYLAL